MPTMYLYFSRICTLERNIRWRKPGLPSRQPRPRKGLILLLFLPGGHKATQPSVEMRDTRVLLTNRITQLIASSQVIAIHFQTVAAANDYWRD